jgi:hypothetical protein
MTHPTRLLVLGLILLVGAAVAYGSLRMAYGARPAYVHVRWEASVDETTRQRLERVHGLTRAEFREDRTWGYFLVDLSTDNIRSLVTNPAAEDTHNLHRTAFRVWRTAPRGEYLGSRPAWIAVLLELLSPALAGIGALAIAGGGFTMWRARTVPATGGP